MLGKDAFNCSMRILIMIVAFNAEKHIAKVLARVPYEQLDGIYEIVIFDDASADATVQVAREAAKQVPIPIRVLRNPENMGYGGNQKLGYQLAIEEGFDAVVMLHGDGQYAPELLPHILLPIFEKKSRVVLGSRMLDKRSALAGGMPLYKWVGNQVLTFIENKMVGTNLSEFHTGYRAFHIDALRRIPFQFNANGFHFDTEILIQFVLAMEEITEVSIPTHYGNEVCHVNGWEYFFNCLRACWQSYFTSKGLFYRRKFDVCSDDFKYQSKLGMLDSSHEVALRLVPVGSKILDVGGGNGWMADELVAKKGCQVCIVDRDFREDLPLRYDCLKVDLGDQALATVPDADIVLLLDVIEHIPRPAQTILLDQLRERFAGSETRFIISVPNTAFLPLRFMFFFFGRLNYGRRGILDETHAFLFTRTSLLELMEECELKVCKFEAIPPPYELALGKSRCAHFLTSLHTKFAEYCPSLFAYQHLLQVSPQPTLRMLLQKSLQSKDERAC